MRAATRWKIAAAVAAATLGSSERAEAQVKTFHLDRLEVPGAPDDGVVLFRPVTQQRNVFYGQLALGYSLRPLKVKNITTDTSVIARTNRTSVIQDQFAIYGSAGFEVLDRATFGVTFPWTPFQTGDEPDLRRRATCRAPAQTKTTVVQTGGPTASRSPPRLPRHVRPQRGSQDRVRRAGQRVLLPPAAARTSAATTAPA